MLTLSQVFKGYNGIQVFVGLYLWPFLFSFDSRLKIFPHLHILIAQVNTSLAAEVPFRLADGHGRPFVQLMGGS